MMGMSKYSETLNQIWIIRSIIIFLKLLSVNQFFFNKMVVLIYFENKITVNTKKYLHTDIEMFVKNVQKD